jgi:hypothetical protein
LLAPAVLAKFGPAWQAAVPHCSHDDCGHGVLQLLVLVVINLLLLLQGVTIWAAQPRSAQPVHVNRASSTAILWHMLW